MTEFKEKTDNPNYNGFKKRYHSFVGYDYCYFYREADGHFYQHDPKLGWMAYPCFEEGAVTWADTENGTHLDDLNLPESEHIKLLSWLINQITDAYVI